MKMKKRGYLWFGQICLIFLLTLILHGCGEDEKVCCGESGGINLNFSSLPEGTLPTVFIVDKVTGIRIYDKIKRLGTSLWCMGRAAVSPGNWKDAAVIFLFCRLSCNVCKITAEVHGHGHETRIVAAQKDGTTQTAVCPGDKKILQLNAAKDNPFIYAILSGQKAEWLSFRVE